MLLTAYISLKSLRIHRRKMSGYTLDGKPVDDKLPEGWGASQRRVGRVGDWANQQVSFEISQG